MLRFSAHVGVLRPNGLFLDRQRPLEKGLGLRVLALVTVEQRQAVEAICHVEVLRAQGLFPDRQRPLVKGLGLRVLTWVGVEPRQVVEARGYVGVLRSEGETKGIDSFDAFAPAVLAE